MDRIYVSSEVSFSNFRCLDILGKEINSGDVIDNTLYLQNMKSGLYVLILSNDQFIVSKKIIVKGLN